MTTKSSIINANSYLGTIFSLIISAVYTLPFIFLYSPLFSAGIFTLCLITNLNSGKNHNAYFATNILYEALEGTLNAYFPLCLCIYSMFMALAHKFQLERRKELKEASGDSPSFSQNFIILITVIFSILYHSIIKTFATPIEILYINLMLTTMNMFEYIAPGTVLESFSDSDCARYQSLRGLLLFNPTQDTKTQGQPDEMNAHNLVFKEMPLNHS